MKLRVTRPALSDLDDILDYITARSPAGASNVQARIKAIIDLLSIYPHVGTLTDDPTIRRIATTPYPFVIFYEVAPGEVIIHAVRHGARAPREP